MRHILSILVNEAGALSRISGLFSARGYNIESLTVAPTEDPTMSRMTIVTSGSEDVIEQITKQLNKLVEVVKVVDLTEGNHIERELMLVKVRAAGKDREEMKRLADIFRELHGRADRHVQQARRVPAGDRARHDPRDRAHRRVGHRARRAHPARLGPVHTMPAQCVASEEGLSRGAGPKAGRVPGEDLQRRERPFSPQPEGNVRSGAPLCVARLAKTPGLDFVVRLDWRPGPPVRIRRHSVNRP
jgi:acetolactate synthase small subunit